MTRHLTLLLCGFSVLAGCAKEPPPRSVTEFTDNPMLLEAAMLRCAADRAKSRYDAECVNARQAVARIQAKEEAARAAALEAISESKRNALRRTQAAAAEARRRSAEDKRRREEAEYLAQFGVLPSGDGDPDEALPEGNVPVAVLPAAGDQSPAVGGGEASPATDGGNAPVAEPGPESPDSDLESVRDELRRRNEEGAD